MTNQDMSEAISHWFGERYRDRATRIASYDFIESFIASAHVDWSIAPRTDKIAAEMAKKVSKLSRQDLAFLLCHSGFIPETYGADSSQETLFSKLVEVLVGE